jgi:phospholipid/cholesterol/gamma-HCH transport system substrate-binding protein
MAPIRTPRTAPGRRPPWSRLRVGLLALVLVAIATYLGFTKHIPFTHGYRVHAVFVGSNNLRPGSPVRIAGVNVGKVVAVGRYKRTNLAEVTMEIQDKGLPIHRDATLKIRPRIFLEGNFFVDLRPGSPSAPDVPEGGTIPVTQTSTPVQLDEVLTALQADSRTDLQTLLKEYGSALSSPPTAAQDAALDPFVQGKTGAQALNDSYRSAPQALKGTALVNSALLGTQAHDLSRTVGALARLTTQLRGHEAQLQSLIGTFNTTAGAFAAQSGALQAAIRLLGPTLTNARDAFASLDASFPPTRAFAREILPGVRETPATIQASFPWIAQTRALLSPSELQGFLAQLQPATEDLARLTSLSIGTRRSPGFLTQLDRANRCFAQVILPTGNVGVNDGALTTRRSDGSVVENYKEFWYAMVGLSGEGANFDGNGNYIRFGVGGGSHEVKFGKSNAGYGTVIGNGNFTPLGTSPRFPNAFSKKNPYGELPYRPDVRCYSSALPNVNGPQAGPGPAPTSMVVPTPPPPSPGGTG